MVGVEYVYTPETKVKNLTHCQNFKAIIGGLSVGVIKFYENEGRWYVNWIEVAENKTRQGIGTELVKRFAGFIGKGKIVRATIVEENSVEIINKSIRKKDYVSEKVFDPVIAANLPLVRLFTKGGINFTKVSIHYYPPGYRLENFDNEVFSSLPDRLQRAIKKEDYLRVEYFGRTPVVI